MITRETLQQILRKAMNTSKLILVQRVRHDKTGDHITKKWVKPDEVQKTDAVLENKQLLSKDHPALKNKPKPEGSPAAKLNPMAKLAALKAKKAQAGAPKPKAAPTKPASPKKPEASSKMNPASAGKKVPAKPSGSPEEAGTGKMPQPKPAAPKKQAAKKTKPKQPAQKKPEPSKAKPQDTYAKTPQTAAAKPPIIRSDVNALGRDKMSDAKIRTIMDSVRADGDAAALTDQIAENSREKAYISLLNTISNPQTLKKIIYTGIIPEDAAATSFMENKLYERYSQIRNAPTQISGSRLNSINATISSAIAGYFPDTQKYIVKNALDTTSLAGADFVFRMTYPAESTMILGSASRGNRQVLANSDTMWYKHMDKTSPEHLFGTGKWFAKKGQSAAQGMKELIRHIGASEPTLAQECAEWEKEFTEIMAVCGEDTDRMNLALNNTYDRVADKFTPTEYNKIVGGVMKLYGASLSDDGNTVFNGDYTQLSSADCLRMTYTTTGTMERQAVMANVMNAWHVMRFSQEICPGQKTTWNNHPGSNSAANVKRNLQALHTLGLNDFRDMQAYVSNTVDRPSTKESNPNYTRSMRTQIAGRAENGDKLFSKDPSPVLDAFRHVVESASSFYQGAKTELQHEAYNPKDMKKAEEFDTPDFGDDELLGLRAMAFTRATCSIQSVTGSAYNKIKAEVEYKEEPAKYNKKGKHLYDERRIIVRGAYKLNNSVMAEKFEERKQKDGVTKTDMVYHGTGFGAGCSVLHDGEFRIKVSGSNSGATLGAGVYVGRSSGKVAPYASTGQCYAAELAELMYENDDYSQNDFADGIIFQMRMSKGKHHFTAQSISSAYSHNKNEGGSADVVSLPAGNGYKAWEAVVSDSDLVCPDIMVDAGMRYEYVLSGIHSKNISRLSMYGPNLARRTNRKDHNSLMDAYIKQLNSRNR